MQQGLQLLFACLLLHGGGFTLGPGSRVGWEESVAAQRTIGIEVGMQNSIGRGVGTKWWICQSLDGFAGCDFSGGALHHRQCSGCVLAVATAGGYDIGGLMMAAISLRIVRRGGSSLMAIRDR